MKRRQSPALHPSTVLTMTELAQHLRMSTDTIARRGIPSFAPGRYLWAHVREWMDAEKAKRQAA